MKKLSYLLFFTCLVFNFSDLCSAEESKKLEISGYYKNLFTSSQIRGSDEDFFADLQRLRLEFKKNITPSFRFHLAMDNEILLNDFANASDFDFIRSKEQQRMTAWDMDKVSVDNDHVYLKHSIYRAYVEYHRPEFQAIVGKQTVDWGKMRFYSPLDLFHPVAPLELERDQRIGIDALNLNFSPHETAGANFIAAAERETDETSLGLKLYKTIATYDLAFIAAKIIKDNVLGISFDGYIKSAGFRGEISHTRTDSKRSFPRASVGVDYSFSENLYALVEHFYNGGREDNDPNTFFSSYKFSQQILSLEKNLSSLWIKYSFSPVLHFNNYLIYDWEGKSVVYNPELNYNISPNLDFSVGPQLYWGKESSEFGSSENLYYAELKWFF